MNTIHKRVAGTAIVLTTLLSCSKEGEQFFVQDGNFPATALTSSAAAVTLTQAAENTTAVTFSWGKASFGDKPVIRYTLQLDLPADTSGDHPWANAKQYTVDNGSFNYSFVGKDLNNVLGTLGVAAGTLADVVFRVKADVPQYNGAASSVQPVYTNTITIPVSTYATSLYIPGGYQGWNPGAAPLLNPVAGRPGMYEGYVYMPGTGVQYFKYTNAPDWNHTNYGDGGGGTFSTDGAAAGLSVADGGYYQLTADLNTNRWTATRTTWSIVGDATPGGWGTDTQMTYDEASQTWKVTCDMTTAGSFKFRANNAWDIDFGLNPTTGKIEYADHPFLGYTPGLWNLTVPETGNYTITLDLHVSQQYTFKLQKN